MSKSTNIKQSEQLHIQENVENNPKQNSPLTEREPIEGTPFTLIKSEDKWFMVMGDYRVTETTKTKEEQLDKLHTEKWLLIMHIAIIAVKKITIEQQTFNEWQKTKENIKKQTETSYETESL